MKSYRSMSSNEGLDRFLSGKHDFATWLRRELSRCVLSLNLMAEQDGIKPDWWEYEFEFNKLRWDIWFTVEGKAHT